MKGLKGNCRKHTLKRRHFEILEKYIYIACRKRGLKRNYRKYKHKKEIFWIVEKI